MSTRTFALLFGLVFLAVGVAGFVPGLVQPLHPDHPPVQYDGGQLFGLFPVNILHNAVHLAFGAWGVIAFRCTNASRVYARGVAIIYAVLTLAGFVPGLQTMFGLTPLFGNDIWLHALLAAVAAYFGWIHRDIVVDRPSV